VTISVTADVAFSPPRNEVEVSVPAGNVMTSVNVWRNDSFGRSLVRSQPSAGFESRTVFDYECPFGQNVTYDWAAEYYDPLDVTPTFTETFASWPGSWTGDTGGGSVSGGVLTLAASDTVSRTLSSVVWDRLDIESIDSSSTVVRFRITSGGTIFNVGSWGTTDPGVLRYGFATSMSTTTSIDPRQPFSITRELGGVTISGTGGSAFVSGTFGDATEVRIENFAGGTSDIGGFEFVTLDAPLNGIAETSSPVNLNPADAWLIAPQAPALSVPLSNSNQQAAGIRELGPVGNSTNTTVHRILGTSTPVTTTTGNRQADTLTATLYTHTSQERQDLRALLAPDTPILINVPSSWDLDLAYGFYQAGDVSESRPYTRGGVPMRDHTIPLTQVRSPEVDVENPGWSYTQVATVWATYTEVLANYATYADLTVDNRN